MPRIDLTPTRTAYGDSRCPSIRGIMATYALAVLVAAGIGWAITSGNDLIVLWSQMPVETIALGWPR